MYINLNNKNILNTTITTNVNKFANSNNNEFHIKNGSFTYYLNNKTNKSGVLRRSAYGKFECSIEPNKLNFNNIDINRNELLSDQINNKISLKNNESFEINERRSKYYFTSKCLIFVIIAVIAGVELYKLYQNIKINNNAKIQSCLKDYTQNNCDVLTKYNEDKTEVSEFIIDYCKEKQICISQSQVIFLEWLFYSNTYNSEINIINLCNINKILVSLIIIFTTIIIINKLIR